ncbi:MAG: SufE family protein [Roseitalea porphyridii]|uniref:SufE family protein n=1 Tax=Roseitalea porphyridii TaxID=1852022 RepID=UPI0032F03861
MTSDLQTILDDFSFLDDWEDRYRYVFDLGRDLPPFPDENKTDENKVRGCVSQVWLTTAREPGDDPVMRFTGDSDAHIVRGLVAIMLALYSGKKASEIAATDAEPVLRQLGLDEHLTPQRANGLRAMVLRMRKDAETALREQA